MSVQVRRRDAGSRRRVPPFREGTNLSGPEFADRLNALVRLANQLSIDLDATKEELRKTQAELNDIKGLVEYRDWCANGMPGLIKPEPEPPEFNQPTRAQA
jgi:hypothetical protein